MIAEYEEVIKGLNGLVRYYSKKRDETRLSGHYRNLFTNSLIHSN
jgi:hypothetical protein